MSNRSPRTVAAFHLGDPSGPSRTLTPVLGRLSGAGELAVALPGPGGATEELGELGRVVYLGHEPMMFPRSPRAAWGVPANFRRDTRRFRALLRGHRADLAVIATSTLPALALAARLEGVPSIVYTTELYRQGSRGDVLRSRIGAAQLRLNAGLATVVVAASKTVAEALPARASVVVSYPSLEPAAEPGDGAGWRREHGLEDASPLVVTMGNIARGRGQDVAVRALADLRRDHPSAQLAIAGEPHPRPAEQAFATELIGLAGELGLSEAVHLCGFAEPAGVLAAADVFVNPARFAETFGRAAMEALVAGRPVVSTRVGAIPEVLAHERHALLVPPDDPIAMAAAIRRVLHEPGLAEGLVADGRAHVLSNFTVEREEASVRRGDRACAGRR